MKDLNKYKGCLIGGAIGDALGYPVEFMKYAEIINRFGRKGITEYILDDDVARISDDTQMTLFTATGFLLGETRGCVSGIMGHPWDYVWLSYKDWYRTQTEDFPIKGTHFSWLDDLPELYSRRAPGLTCLSVLSSDTSGSVEKPINSSKGCGGVMRVAPIGLYYGEKNHYKIEDAEVVGAEVAALTHGHPLGYIPAEGLVHIIALLAHNDMTIEEAVNDMRECLYRKYYEKQHNHITEFINMIDNAIGLAKDKRISAPEAIHKLGEGWVAEEALAISIFCALRYSTDFEKAIIAAVNHDGDSDSTGSITGNIVGANLGLSAIPEKFIKKLELRDVILEIAEDLYQDCKIGDYIDSEDPDWEDKYWHNRKAQRHSSRKENMTT